jgi:hypothetical protein
MSTDPGEPTPAPAHWSCHHCEYRFTYIPRPTAESVRALGRTIRLHYEDRHPQLEVGAR